VISSSKEKRPDHSPAGEAVDANDLRPLVEEMGCAIAEAQAALLAGRFRDLEHSAAHLNVLCASLKALQSRARINQRNGSSAVYTAALSLRQRNKTFAAVLRRMRRHLNGLSKVIGGASLNYEPATKQVREV
jgi:hypothetical protein